GNIGRERLSTWSAGVSDVPTIHRNGSRNRADSTIRITYRTTTEARPKPGPSGPWAFPIPKWRASLIVHPLRSESNLHDRQHEHERKQEPGHRARVAHGEVHEGAVEQGI